MTTIKLIMPGAYRLAGGAGTLPTGTVVHVRHRNVESEGVIVEAYSVGSVTLGHSLTGTDTMFVTGDPFGATLARVLCESPQAGPTPDPTPRERGQQTCRAALMTVIGMHRRGDGLLDAAPFIVAAVQALMDLDGLRAGEAADLDVAKERDDARALAEGLTRGQDDLRRQMKAITGDRDLAVEDRDYARARMNKAEAEVKAVLEQSAVLQATCNRLTEERDAARDVGDAFGRAAEVERDRLQLENGRLHRAMDEMQAAQVEREAVWDRAMRIIGWCDVQVLVRMLQRALDRKKSP